MWTGDKVFFDLVSTAVGDRYALQAFIDATKEAYNKLDLSGFNWPPSLLPFSYFCKLRRSMASMQWLPG